MAFVPIPGTVRSVLRFQQGTEERQSVLHYHKDAGSPTEADLIAINGNLESWWNGPGRQASSSTLNLFEIVSTDISVENGVQVTHPVSPPVAGAGGGNASPGNATGTASWRTGRTGRSFRGRTYWPGFWDEVVNTDSTMSSALQIAVAAAAANLLFGFTVSGYHLAVASKVLAVATPIISVIVENVIDSQRRRLPKRGI